MNATNECRMARIDEFNDKRRLYCIKVRMMMTYIKGLTFYLRSEQTTQTLGASWVAIGSASIWVCLGCLGYWISLGIAQHTREGLKRPIRWISIGCNHSNQNDYLEQPWNGYAMTPESNTPQRDVLEKLG